MTFKPYPAYKDSGVEWLEEVPEHWEVLPLKYIVSIPITDGPHETPEFIDAGIPFVSAEAVSSGIVEFSKIRGFISKEDHQKFSKKYLPRKNDIFMVKSGATTGVTAIVETDDEFNIWSPLAVIRCGEAVQPKFVLNFMRSRNFLEGITLNWSFGTQQNIGMGVIENLSVTVPPEKEQQKIIAFLNHETTRIDALISEQQRLIELLKEKRQAVISHAVTKGLDPTVPMKDSGVEWLGEVPAYWKIARLGHYADVLTGFPFPSAGFSQDETDTKLLRGINVGVSELKWDDTVYWKIKPHDDLSKYLMPIGKVILGMDRPWISDGLRIARVGHNDVPCLLLQRVAAITPHKQLDETFLYNLLYSGLFRIYVEPDLTGVSVPHISPDQILNFVIALPPLEEQIMISQRIESEIHKIEKLFGEANKSHKLLQERRSALISAAVTGKIDVRDWQPPANTAPTLMEMTRV